MEHPDYLPVRKYIMNPKAVTIGELYGEVNPTTLEWRDGILGMAVRYYVHLYRYIKLFSPNGLLVHTKNTRY